MIISVPKIVIVTIELAIISSLKKERFKPTLKIGRGHPLVPGQGAGSTAGGRERNAQLLPLVLHLVN